MGQWDATGTQRNNSSSYVNQARELWTKGTNWQVCARTQASTRSSMLDWSGYICPLLNEFAVRTVSYGTSFPLRFMAHVRSAWAINRRQKTRIRNLRYGTRRRGKDIYYICIVCLTGSATFSIHEEWPQISEAGRNQTSQFEIVLKLLEHFSTQF